ncbi:hypothetical protein BH10PSE19_BH10PSE19_05460 [soil metagenome]
MGLGGVVINSPTGIIDGFVGVETAGAASTVVNFGLIGGFQTAAANSSVGVALGSGGAVANFGSIFEGSRGISVDGGFGRVFNTGLIDALFGIAIDMTAGGSIVNLSRGIITGGDTRSIFIENGLGTVINRGLISGGTIAAIELGGANSLVNNSGIIEGDVLFHKSQDIFLMTSGNMVGNILMGTEGHETAIFKM